VKKIDVIIPAYNEENSVGRVIEDLPMDMLKEVIVVDNNSSDATEARALGAGATVLKEPRQGYGAACLKAMDHIARKPAAQKPDYVVFIDADYSDFPEQLPLLTNRLDEGCDLVIGSRALGQKERGAMLPQQVFGNWLATGLIKILYGVTFTDLGPFRAIRYDRLLALGMNDQNYGWTVEMQVKAAQQKLVICEVPVNYRKRIGQSKVTGTLKGTLGAGYKIIYTIFKYL
jgi:glycosyltransferase involved in cell wall biosynthesis